MHEHHLRIDRRARFYTIGDDAAARPYDDVWIVCHGYGQLAGEFVRGFERVARPGRLIAAPEALNRYYVDTESRGSHADARVGATWMTREDRESEIADYVEYLDALHALLVPQGARVTALGFSQGVATVARWIASGSARVDRFVAWAGQWPADVALDRLAARLNGAPLLLVHGSKDQFATWVSADETVARLTASGIAVESIAFQGGHRLDDGVLDRLAAN